MVTRSDLQDDFSLNLRDTITQIMVTHITHTNSIITTSIFCCQQQSPHPLNFNNMTWSLQFQCSWTNSLKFFALGIRNH